MSGVEQPLRFVTIVCRELLATLPYAWIGVQLADDKAMLKKLAGALIVAGEPGQPDETLKALGKRVLAKVEPDSPMVLEPGVNPAVIQGRFRFDPETLAWGNDVLSQTLPCHLLVVDELGPLELERGEGWVKAFDVLRKPNFVLALVVVRPELVVGTQSQLPGGATTILTVTPDNRDDLPAVLLETLERAGLEHAGAGRNIEEAALPAALEIPGKGRVLVFSFGSETSGIPRGWAASQRRPGVDLLEDLSAKTVTRIAERVRGVKRPGDIAVASIHWGGNWGYEIPRRQTEFARGLIDEAGFDVIHGHSSHHPKAIEVYKKRPILYGCGDFLNDYEGIGGYEGFRNDLCLMYLVTSDPETGELERLRMIPLRIERFVLTRASSDDARWLSAVLDREARKFECRVLMNQENQLILSWT